MSDGIYIFGPAGFFGLVLGILALNAHDNLDVTLAYIFVKGNGAIGIMYL